MLFTVYVKFKFDYVLYFYLLHQTILFLPGLDQNLRIEWHKTIITTNDVPGLCKLLTSIFTFNFQCKTEPSNMLIKHYSVGIYYYFLFRLEGRSIQRFFSPSSESDSGSSRAVLAPQKPKMKFTLLFCRNGGWYLCIRKLTGRDKQLFMFNCSNPALLEQSEYHTFVAIYVQTMLYVQFLLLRTRNTL